MKKIISLFILLLVACACPTSYTITRSGLFVVNQSPLIDAEDVESITKCMLERHGIKWNRIQKLTIEIKVSYVVECNGYFANGCYYCNQNLIKVAYYTDNPEGWRGTLRHELLHWILEQQGQSCSQQNHNDPIWFHNDC